MIYTIYKPNKNINGGLATFRVKKQKKEGESDWSSSLFIELLKQNTWNSEKHTGTFDKESRKFITLNVAEAGEFINTFKNNVAFSTFHKSSKGSASISLSPYNWKRNVNAKDVDVVCFGLSVKANNLEYKIPITPGESQVLIVLLEHFIKEQSSLALKEEERKRSTTKISKSSEEPSEENPSEQDIPF